jgi:hypothetical protein
MSAKLQPQYISLTSQIIDAEYAEDQKVQEIADLNLALSDVKKKEKNISWLRGQKRKDACQKIFLKSCLKVGNKNNSLSWGRNRINHRDM